MCDRAGVVAKDQVPLAAAVDAVAKGAADQHVFAALAADRVDAADAVCEGIDQVERRGAGIQDIAHPGVVAVDDVVVCARADVVAGGAAEHDVVAASRGQGVAPPSAYSIVSITPSVIGRPASCGRPDAAAVIRPLSPITTLSPLPALIVSPKRPPMTMSWPSPEVMPSTPPATVVEVLSIRSMSEASASDSHVGDAAIVTEHDVVALADTDAVAFVATQHDVAAAAGGDAVHSAVVERGRLDHAQRDRQASELRCARSPPP